LAAAVLTFSAGITGAKAGNTGLDEASTQSESFSAPPVPVETAPARAPSAIPTIGAVSVTGGDRLGVVEMAQTYGPFVGRSADPATLQELARTLADVARSHGYLFATAVVPSQSVDLGVVRVKLELGRIDQVRIVGSRNRQLRSILNRLVGPAPKAAQVERRLLLAGDLPGMTVLGTRYDRQNGLGILEVRVSDVRYRSSVTIDTYGSRAYGPVRVRLSAEADNIAGSASSVDMQAIKAIENNELSYASLRYRTTMRSGTLLTGASVSVGASRPGGTVRYRLDGRSAYGSLFANANLMRSRKASLWVNTELSVLAVDEGVYGRTFQRDRTLTAMVTLSGNHAVGSGRIYGELGVVRGLVPASRLGAGHLPSARPEASSVFTKTVAWASYVQPISGRTTVRASVLAQAARKPLPVSQELGLGGPTYGRAYDFNERYGDQGVLASVEVSHDLASAVRDHKTQVYAFADAGRVRERGLQRNGQGSLASAGAGVRVTRGRLDLSVEAAAPLTAPRYATKDRSPRLTVQLGLRF